jgi:acyl-CoA reductase LuxC
VNDRAPDEILDARVRVLAPAHATTGLAGFLEASKGLHQEPFSAQRREIVGALSARFLNDPWLRRDPASVAVGYWMRPAAVSLLKASFDRRQAADPSLVRAPVGRVFHVAPSNVDTLFVYSWVLSYLCGNANVVRVSQDPTPAVEAMLRVISGVAEEHPELAASNRFLTYEHDDEVTGRFSAWCTHRILWGGNETIAALRPLPLNPHASERVFGSKFSYAIVSLERYQAANAAERERLAGAFFNDLFWFDQMACSSPHIVFWVGGEPGWQEAIGQFEDRLQAEVGRRNYVPSASNSVHRLVHAFGVAAGTDVRVGLEHPGFIGIRVADAGALDKRICGGGLIRHARIDDLAQLEGFASDEDQTVTYFGFDRDALIGLATSIGARGVDRIVPIGEALSFEVAWDGFDLIDDLTRKVSVHLPRPERTSD